jgi:hypothetical protein
MPSKNPSINATQTNVIRTSMLMYGAMNSTKTNPMADVEIIKVSIANNKILFIEINPSYYLYDTCKIN